MNNLTLFLLGLVIPACLSQNSNPGGEQCFSQALNPSYPCCKNNVVVYVDKDGEWGVENGQWCGIGGVDVDTCFSLADGYSCCESCDVIYTDNDGDWGVENGKWCGIKDSCKGTRNDEFDFSFLKLENNKTNMIYSPLSISYALNMLEDGANGNTYDEINAVVGNGELTKYSSIGKNLSFANSVFIRDTYYKFVKQAYINAVEKKYNAEIIQDEFKSADNANKWIEDKTLGIIKDMVKDEVAKNPNLAMLIINALAIDMEWAFQFSDDKTYGETFYKDDGKEMTATMLFNKEVSSENIAYYMDDNLTVLNMDLKEYNGTQFEFMAIMPKENLSGYVENVTKEQISEIDKQLKLSSDETFGVNVKIPKFKFSYDLELTEDLKNLGIQEAFDERRANFSKMAEANDLYVSEALHKADIDFTEKGVKAAAVTVIIMMTKGALPKETNPVNVIINKPFMFIIRDKNTKDIWFTGTVYEPNSWENDKEDYTPSFGF